jgi:hypothetical protein
MVNYNCVIVRVMALLLFVNNACSQEFKYFQPEEILQTEKIHGGFYPIGWSVEESLFAWLQFNTETFDATPPEGYFFEVTIMNVKTQEAVFTKRYYGDAVFDFTLKNNWNRYSGYIKTKLKEYGIRQNNAFEVLTFPFNHNGYRYGVLVEKTFRGELEEYQQRLIEEKIFLERRDLISNDFLKKAVTRKVYNSDDLIVFNESRAFPNKCIMSPSGSKLVLLKIKGHYYHGDYSKHLELIGANLSSPFGWGTNYYSHD